MKNVIYYNDTGFPYSVLAAAVRNGDLPIHRAPDRMELEVILQRSGLGKGDASIINLGCNTRGEKCLALWTKGNGDMVLRTIKSFLGIFHIENYEAIPIHCRKTPLLAIGTYLACLPGLRSVGMLLIHHQVKAVYGDVIDAARMPQS